MSEAKEKIKLKDVLNRNLVLILLIQVLSDCVNSMVGAYSNMSAKAVGVTVAMIGIAASVYSISGLIVRMPAGAMADSQKKKLALCGALALRMFAVLFLSSFGMTGSGTNYIIARAIYGVGWSFVGVILPAVVAMMMDKRTMGTTFAVVSIIQQFTKSYVKSLAVSTYKSSGPMAVAFLCVGTTVAAMVLTMFLDFNDPKVLAATPKKKSKGGSLKLNYVPICLLLSMVVFGWQMNTQFDNVVAQERNIDIASILAISAFITPITAFATSALCDIVDPKLVACVLYTFLGVGNLIVARATTYNLFAVGEILSLIGIQYSKVISIYLFKNCAPTEKGAVHATSYMCTDVLSIVSTTVLGYLITGLGYETTYTITGIMTLASVVIVWSLGTKLIQHATASAAEGEAPEAKAE